MRHYPADPSAAPLARHFKEKYCKRHRGTSLRKLEFAWALSCEMIQGIIRPVQEARREMLYFPSIDH